MHGNLVDEVSSKITLYEFSYYIWSIIFYILCASIVALPILIASGLLSEARVKVVAFISAVAAAIATWSNLGAVSGNFGSAYSELLVARAEYFVTKDEKKLTEAYKDAVKTTFQWRPGLPNIGSK